MWRASGAADPKPKSGPPRPLCCRPLMFAYLLRRLALTLPTFIALMFVTFAAIRLVPGDPVEVRVGERGISAERLAMFRHDLGLDQPVWQQFLAYGGKLLQGDFGTSLATNQSVLTEFATLFPATIELSLAAMLFAVLLGIPAGTIAAARRGTVFDQTLMGLSVTGYSMPIFWWGLLLIMFVAERWGLTPVSGRIDLIKFYFEPVTGFMVVDAWLSGQAGAVKHGIAQALSKFEPLLRSSVKSAGFLTRDSRVVERKKYGKAKARKSFQFSKR